MNGENPYEAPKSETRVETFPLIVGVFSVVTLVVAIAFPLLGTAYAGQSGLIETVMARAPVLFLLAWSWCLAAILLVARDMRRFLAAHPRIDSPMHLHALKDMVRQNMYMALVQMAMLLITVTAGVASIIHQGLPVLVGVAVAMGLFSLISRYALGLEQRIRDLPVATETLEREYRHICHSWVHHALPRF